MGVERPARKRMGGAGRILIAGASLLLAWGMFYYYNGILLSIRVSHFGVAGHGNSSDLYPVWVGSRELLLHRKNPYGPEVTGEIQEGFYGQQVEGLAGAGSKNPEAFAYPVYVAFLMAPVLSFSWESVRISYQILMLILSPVSVLLWLRAFGLPWRFWECLLALTAVMSSFAFLDAMHLEQTTLLVGVLVAGSVYALASGRYGIAGLLLALASVKPQLTILLAAFFLLWALGDWQARKWFAIGYGVVMGALLVGSELLLPGWVGLWRQSAQAYVGYHHPSLLATLAGPFGGRISTILAVACCGWLFWRLRKERARSRRFNFAVVVALTLTQILLPISSGAYYNQLLLIPAVLWYFEQGSSLMIKGVLPRLTWLIALIALVGQWILALFASVAATVLHYRFQSEATLLVGAPEVLVFAFPGFLALFVLSVAPRFWTTSKAVSG